MPDIGALTMFEIMIRWWREWRRLRRKFRSFGQLMAKDDISETASDVDLQFILNIFEYIIGRKPIDKEITYGLHQLKTGRDPREYALELTASPEARRNRSAPLFVPPGHYYSPIVNIAELIASRAEQPPVSEHLDIDVDPKRQIALFRELSTYFGQIPFPVTQSSDFRYYFENNFYSYGDALILSAFIQRFRPNRIIEVGCGFSSAVILDTLDRLAPCSNTQCVFIEPFPDRLNLLLKPSDYKRVTIIEQTVQKVEVALFLGLQENDILFFDTTHVLKTGSDVQHELFTILPRLNPGVLIHFHDVFDGFEYPDAWVLQENRSWNELYALRAFLMNNSKYKIMLMNATIAKNYPEEVCSISNDFMKNPGGALWLRKEHSSVD